MFRSMWYPRGRQPRYGQGSSHVQMAKPGVTLGVMKSELWRPGEGYIECGGVASGPSYPLGRTQRMWEPHTAHVGAPHRVRSALTLLHSPSLAVATAAAPTLALANPNPKSSDAKLRKGTVQSCAPPIVKPAPAIDSECPQTLTSIEMRRLHNKLGMHPFLHAQATHPPPLLIIH
ncbi:hypothetical protein C8J57DRAFT_1473109 [Mycena rebaudengoi]|nr:hypothetical protein C8J57DRAFT_1473109 [Mycena rebaudengoi]